MANVYKTPGVYVEEISLLPPSVAEVETAIPAFIGYTERAEKNGMSLNMVPTPVLSMMEYRQYFGGAPACTPTVKLDENNVVVSVDAGENEYFLYDSLQLFFNNGGGKCYIVSVGLYGDPVQKGDDISGLLGGLKKLEKEDEPTLILSPDAVLMPGATDLYDLQQAAIKQSAELQDRFVLCDLKSGELDTVTQEFRDHIGINSLKYSAAYVPWLKANLNKNMLFRNITIQRASSSEAVMLETLTNDADIKAFLTGNLRGAIAVNDDINTNLLEALGTNKSLKNKFEGLKNALETAKVQTDLTIDMLQPSIRAIYNLLRDILHQMLVQSYNSITDTSVFKLKSDLKVITINNNLPSVLKSLICHHNSTIGFASGKIFPTAGPNVNILTSLIDALNTIAEIDAASPDYITKDDTSSTIDDQYTGVEADPDAAKKKADIVCNAAISAFAIINSAVNEFLYTAANYETTFDKSLPDIFGLYKTILNKISDSLNVIPPSGAIAGIYAYVDSARGVWKAPANVSLNSVAGPSVLIDNRQQEGLNVDANAGKSINAIRAFAGKGTLIWGARTLAGNDNEWRYIPVRRFYNFAEESIKKGTSWVVFEPNDANTWTRVKAMIENFLIKQWRNGALAGAKPDDAFFVKVGLGQTMTALDILEGRMNIEIGMAVVRPAEFIILKFSHLMQKS